MKLENNDIGGSYLREQNQKREDADFVSEKNLGDLDMDSFFDTFGEEQFGENDIDEVPGMSDDDDDDDKEEEDSNDEDDDDDDDDDVSDGDEQKLVAKKSKNISRMTEKGATLRQQVQKDQHKDQNASGSDSDSEEEDVEQAERRMREEMGKLQEKDPEFHRFLKENEETLLKYGVNDDDDDNEEEGGAKVSKKKHSESATLDDDTEDNLKSQNADGTIQLTAAMVQKMELGAFKSHGVKALKRLVNAFMSACHLADENRETFFKGQRQRYSIDSSDVFDRLMVLSLTKCHEEFKYHLLGKGASRSKNGGGIEREKKSKNDDVDDDVGHDDKVENEDHNKPINPKLLESAGGWSDINPILFTFLKSAIHMLSEAKEPELVVFVLKSLTYYVPYLTPFPRLAEVMLKTLTNLWSAPIDSSEDYQVVRLHSFLRIRQLALTQPFPFIEECLKKLYLAYAQRAKFATAASVSSALPTLTFMGNCVVELYSLDYHSSYQHAFIYIRQLALHLRTAMQKKTADVLGAVYCWQFLHCLKLWVAVLTEACQSNDDNDGDGPANTYNGEEQLLRSLIFPLSQVIIGTARLIPSTRHLPLRLHCVRLLQQLAAAAEIFLPTTSILLDVFDMSELSQPPKKVSKSNIQPMALTLKLRPESPLRSMEEMEMCLAEVFVLINREIDLYRYSAGFPEFATRINQRLKKVWLILRHCFSFYFSPPPFT
jgi:nucleolar complex protein 2